MAWAMGYRSLCLHISSCEPVEPGTHFTSGPIDEVPSDVKSTHLLARSLISRWSRAIASIYPWIDHLISFFSHFPKLSCRNVT
jgi:hypothetical protein